MLFSIIVPVYNVEKYLKSCVDSILSQSYTDFELILVDDGSMDSSGEICDKYKTLDDRVIVTHISNAGVSNARNIGIHIAKGEYLFFVDSDDYLKDGALKALSDLQDRNADIIIFGFDYYIEDENRIEPNIPSELGLYDRLEFFMGHFMNLHYNEFLNSPWNKLFKRSLIVDNGLEFNRSFSICEDMAFNIEALSFTKDVVISNRSHYIYNIKNYGSLVFKFHLNYDEAMNYYMDCWYKYFDLLVSQENSFTDEVSKYMNNYFINKKIFYFKRLVEESSLTKHKIIKRIYKNLDDVRMKNAIADIKTNTFKRSIIIRMMRYKKSRLIFYTISIIKFFSNYITK